MSTLVVINYNDPYKAEEVRLKLRKLQSEYLLDLEDAVVAVKDEKGKVKLNQAVNLTATGCDQWWILGHSHRTDLSESAARLRCWRHGRRGYRWAHRCRNQRSFHEGASRRDGSRQFNAIRAGKKSHAGQGAR